MRVAVMETPTGPRLISIVVIGSLVLLLGLAYDRLRPRALESPQ